MQQSLSLASPPTTFREERELGLRIFAEFREMPGLVLTVAQAARLFSVDAVSCERVLRYLVEGGVLALNGRTFARADACRT